MVLQSLLCTKCTAGRSSHQASDPLAVKRHTARSVTMGSRLRNTRLPNSPRQMLSVLSPASLWKRGAPTC